MEEYAKNAPSGEVRRDAIPFLKEIDGCNAVALSGSEIEHFKSQGFIVKKGLVEDVDALARVVDYVWDIAPTEAIERDNSTTWLNEPSKRWPKDHVHSIGFLHGTNWKMRSPQKIGCESFLLNASARDPNVQQIVKAFLGSSIVPSMRVRGVYVVLPQSPDQEGRLGPHVDHAAAQLSAMVLVDDIEPRMGGFSVWPRSHIRLHRYWQSCFGANFEPSLKNDFDEEFKRILNDTNPVEFVGKAGDVVFWHPRLIHSAGVNYSVETGKPRIRYVVPCDFQQDGFTFFDDDDLGPGTNHQWWVDTRHYREDPRPTPENLWDQWVI